MSEDDSARLLDELGRLRVEAEALRKRLSANHDPFAQYTGEDRSGLARVIVDCHGRAADVVLARDWRRAADPAGLASALVHAAGQAQSRRVEAWAAGGAPPEATLFDPAAPRADRVDGRDLLPLLALAEERLTDATARLEHHFTEPAVLSSPGGELTLTLQGGQVVDIEFDEGWIGSATAVDIAQLVCLLFQRAHDRSWTGIGDLLPPELRDVLSISTDPRLMLWRLGLDT